jgi:pimeloyl-ACP methyl ester carboxylesterase
MRTLSCTTILVLAIQACSSAQEPAATTPTADSGTSAPIATLDANADDGSKPIEPDAAKPDAAPAEAVVPADAIPYRALSGHPGCTTAGLAYPPAAIPGYSCAAKAYLPAADNPLKPIVLLVHGNSSTPADFERFPSGGPPMLAERLTAEGYRAYAVDLRIDLNDDSPSDNPAKNVDHGWATPIVQHFVESVMAAHPSREISIVGFSFGVTVTRDALRRLQAAGKKPFERIHDLVFLAGSNHGVSTYRNLCGKNPSMRGRVACELGDRTTYSPTLFLAALNGLSGATEMPCLDGDHIFETAGACGGHAVEYTTIVMKDVVSSSQFQDELTSEDSARLGRPSDVSANGALVNRTVDLVDSDPSGYFYNGLFHNHYGALRSQVALTAIMAALSD